jgi:hypothetical protein
MRSTKAIKAAITASLVTAMILTLGFMFSHAEDQCEARISRTRVQDFEELEEKIAQQQKQIDELINIANKLTGEPHFGPNNRVFLKGINYEPQQ